MTFEMLTDASYMLMRTNVKLTTNVKLIVDSRDNLYLDSFNANSELTNSKFKAYKLDPDSSYSKDLYQYYDAGKFPKELAYEVYQEYPDTKIQDDYGKQFENFYSYGTEYIVSKFYTERMGLFAPIWLNKEIPNYFVIFKLDTPVAINYKNATSENEYTDQVLDPTLFNENILSKSTIIKTFDLSKKSNIGKYIRNYRESEDFPVSPFTYSSQEDRLSTWNGISYDRKGFVSKGEFVYENYVNKDSSIIQSEHFLTKGYERLGVVCPNILNLQFLFDDKSVEDNYEFNRYYGMYVNTIEEGTFKMDDEIYYSSIKAEKNQSPFPSNSKFLSLSKDIDFTVNNDDGVLFYTKDVESTTDLPGYLDVSTLSSIFYVKDKNDYLHNLKTLGKWNYGELRLSDISMNFGDFVGFESNVSFSKGLILTDKGKAHCRFNIDNTIPDKFSISFYDSYIDNVTSENILIGQVAADATLLVPGENNYHYFNPTGTSLEVAQSLSKAINSLVSDKKFFVASVYETDVIVESNFTGTRFNKLYFTYNEELAPPTFNYYPSTKYFVGGSDDNQSRIKVKLIDVDNFEVGKYVRISEGYSQIVSTSLFLNPLTYNNNNEVTSYTTETNDYMIVIIKSLDVKFNSFSEISIYTEHVPSFGRLSIFPIKDFDVDFYSTEYFDQGELFTESDEYNTFYLGTDENLVPNGKTSHPDILDFYENGFGRLQGLLVKEVDTLDSENEIISEYDRLSENYVRELSTVSRTIPFINKWSIQGMTDVRNKDYRLNMSDAFGMYNFAPSKDSYISDSRSFTHEWYYLSKYPTYFFASELQDSWSYFDQKVYDNKESTLSDPFSLGFFQDVTTDNFSNYFVVDRLLTGNEFVPLNDIQVRFSKFLNGNNYKFSSTLFRGVNVQIKQREDYNMVDEDKIDINYNIESLSFLKNKEFNDYKFSSVLIPHQNEVLTGTGEIDPTKKPKFQIKFVQNKKWKTITMMIFLDINYPYFDDGREFIDRTMLYSLNSKIEPDADGDFTEPYTYSDIEMQGAIDFERSFQDTNNGEYMIYGMPSRENIASNFIEDIRLKENGKYMDVQFEVNGIGGGTFIISGIKAVYGTDSMRATSVKRNGIEYSLPTTSPSESRLELATYTVLGGGYNFYTDLLKKVSFANIYEEVNQGNPDIIYETVSDSGEVSYNEYIITLDIPSAVMKSVYLSTQEDDDRPVQFNTIDNIGYRLNLSTDIYIVPFYRMEGHYSPKFKDVIKFEDPYLEQILTDGTYEKLVFDKVRFKNTHFKLDATFGIIENLMYHKVNVDNPRSILELSKSKNSAYSSVYSLIDEIGIDKNDRYVFHSNWDSGYNYKNITKSSRSIVAGTRNVTEHKSFMASKVLYTPASLTIETFTISAVDAGFSPGNSTDIEYIEFDNSIQFNVYLTDRLIEHLYDSIYPIFIKYVNPKFSYGNKDGIEGMVREYIRRNIISRYSISGIHLYTRKIKGASIVTFTSMSNTDDNKVAAGLTIEKNVNINNLGKDLFDFSMILNLEPKHIYEIGLSIDLENI